MYVAQLWYSMEVLPFIEKHINNNNNFLQKANKQYEPCIFYYITEYEIAVLLGECNV